MSRRVRNIVGAVVRGKQQQNHESLPLLTPGERWNSRRVYSPFPANHNVNGGEKMNTIIIQEKKWRKMNSRGFRRRNVWLFINILVCLSLLVVVFQIEWNGAVRIPNRFSDYLKAIINGLSLMQILQTIEYYLLLIEKKTHMFLSMGEQPPSQWHLFTRFSFQWRFWVEIIIILPQPFPLLPNLDKMGLLMFLRLYVGLKLVRDYSRIYKNRKRISKLAGFPPSIEPGFNAALSVKTLYHDHPISFCGLLALILGFICGWILHVLEREGQPEAFTLDHSVFLAISMMLTGWPSDINSNWIPDTIPGTILSYLLATVGVSIFTLFLNYVINDLLYPSKLQRAAVLWAQFAKLKDASDNASAKLIQIVWKHYRKRKSKSHISHNKEQDYKVHLKKQIRICKLLRWQLDSVELVAKEQPTFKPVVPNKIANEDKGLEKKQNIEQYLDTALADIKEELLNEIAKLIKKSFKGHTVIPKQE